MDCPEITHLSLCSGYGGIDLGLRRCIPNLRTVAYAEIEAFACELLLARMEGGQLDAAPIWTDLKRFPWQKFRGLVDVLSGGYPCQPFSSAGKRLGGEDPRHLWPFISSGIQLLQPRICFFENVEGHITQGLHHVLSDLGGLGYRTTWGIFSASEGGAPHQRKRVFIMADRDGEGLQGLRGKCEYGKNCGQIQAGGSCGYEWPSRPGQPQFGWEPPRVVGNASGFNVSRQAGRQRETEIGGAGPEYFMRQTEPALGRDADGPAGGMDYAQLCVSGDNRTDELRLLGNGVVPAVAERAFQILSSRLA